MTKYNTNLASEFYILSALHRIGLDASLTLGNKKSVDIFVYSPGNSTITIDVKGVAKKDDWPVDNIDLKGKENHFIVFVCFNGKIHNPECHPSVWVVPSKEVHKFIKKYKNRTVVSQSLVSQHAGIYKNAYSLLFDKNELKAYYPIKFEVFVGGYFGTSYNLSSKNGILKYKATTESAINSSTKEITPTGNQWYKFYNLMDEINAWVWKLWYKNPGILDGTQWKVNIHFHDKQINSKGDNNYPCSEYRKESHGAISEQFIKFLSAIRELINGLPFE